MLRNVIIIIMKFIPIEMVILLVENQLKNLTHSIEKSVRKGPANKNFPIVDNILLSMVVWYGTYYVLNLIPKVVLYYFCYAMMSKPEMIEFQTLEFSSTLKCRIYKIC